MKIIMRMAVLLLLILVSTSASAEQSQDFGQYVVHFNALNTNFIPPDVARGYGINRSKSRALLNVVVLQKIMDTPGIPMHVTIQASGKNLVGQFREISMREIAEPGSDGSAAAIYYIGELPITNQETINFTLTITPDGETEPLVVKFKQEFYTQ